MMDPKQMTNDVLAMHIELWENLNDELAEPQKKFFQEVCWRLRLMPEPSTYNVKYGNEEK